MKTKTLLSTMALTLATSAFAAGEKHDHAHEHKPLHGGVVVEVKDIDYELVAKPTVIQLHLRDHGKPAGGVRRRQRGIQPEEHQLFDC